MSLDAILPLFLFVGCAVALALALLVISLLSNPKRPSAVTRMPYESGMDPVHDTRRRFDVRFNLLAIAFLVFDVELLFLFPWAVAMRPAKLPAAEAAGVLSPASLSPGSLSPGIDAAVAGGLVGSRGLVFGGVMVFIGLLTVGYMYDWRKGIFRWR
jgi:NADH-quinone oxidoreductase subunit A